MFGCAFQSQKSLLISLLVNSICVGSVRVEVSSFELVIKPCLDVLSKVRKVFCILYDLNNVISFLAIVVVCIFDVSNSAMLVITSELLTIPNIFSCVVIKFLIIFHNFIRPSS
ncbi:hypothetical protein BpHYR1_001846 [Brachionus plicatilis]|uniref:Uncharacterized protein n=1 Tax=Brachionus plicatilis TaxID=10195 RepID=A0A3M7QV56_BRAPC|nr:hypothetical protein BpHYR1_001846 [Brachionus plicatilis]